MNIKQLLIWLLNNFVLLKPPKLFFLSVKNDYYYMMQSLLDLSAYKIATTFSCNDININDDLLLSKIANFAFPTTTIINAELNFVKSINEITDDLCEFTEIYQIGFMLIARMSKYAYLYIIFEKQQIIYTFCQMCPQNTVYCEHIIAAIKYRQSNTATVTYPPLTNLLLPLNKLQLIKLIQHTAVHNPINIFSYLECCRELRDSTSIMAQTYGAPDITFGYYDDTEVQHKITNLFKQKCKRSIENDMDNDYSLTLYDNEFTINKYVNALTKLLNNNPIAGVNLALSTIMPCLDTNTLYGKYIHNFICEICRIIAIIKKKQHIRDFIFSKLAYIAPQSDWVDFPFIENCEQTPLHTNIIACMAVGCSEKYYTLHLELLQELVQLNSEYSYFAQLYNATNNTVTCSFTQNKLTFMICRIIVYHIFKPDTEHADDRIIKYCLIALELNRFCLHSAKNIPQHELYNLLKLEYIIYDYMKYKLNNEFDIINLYLNYNHNYGNCYPIVLLGLLYEYGAPTELYAKLLQNIHLQTAYICFGRYKSVYETSLTLICDKYKQLTSFKTLIACVSYNTAMFDFMLSYICNFQVTKKQDITAAIKYFMHVAKVDPNVNAIRRLLHSDLIHKISKIAAHKLCKYMANWPTFLSQNEFVTILKYSEMHKSPALMELIILFYEQPRKCGVDTYDCVKRYIRVDTIEFNSLSAALINNCTDFETIIYCIIKRLDLTYKFDDNTFLLLTKAIQIMPVNNYANMGTYIVELIFKLLTDQFNSQFIALVCQYVKNEVLLLLYALIYNPNNKTLLALFINAYRAQLLHKIKHVKRNEANTIISHINYIRTIYKDYESTFKTFNEKILNYVYRATKRKQVKLLLYSTATTSYGMKLDKYFLA